jgi:hypothetical protein
VHATIPALWTYLDVTVLHTSDVVGDSEWVKDILLICYKIQVILEPLHHSLSTSPAAICFAEQV